MENFRSDHFETKSSAKSKNKLAKTFVTAAMLLASMWYADWQQIKDQQPKPKNKTEKPGSWKKKNTEFKVNNSSVVISGNNNWVVIQSDWNIVIDDIDDWDASNITIINGKVWINWVEQKKPVEKSKPKANNTNKKKSSAQ